MNTASKLALVTACLIVIVWLAYYTYVPRVNDEISVISSDTVSGGQEKAFEILVPSIATHTPTTAKNAEVEPSFPMPDLNRSVIARIPLSASSEENTRKNIFSLTERLRKDPDDYSLWIGLGIYRKTLGDYEGAEEIWKYVTIRWPTDFVAYNNLGNLYHSELKNLAKAEEYYLRAIEFKPDFIQSYINLYELYRYSYKGTEKEAQAPQPLLTGLAKNPESMNLMVMLARYYSDSGSKELASRYYKMAIDRAFSMSNAKTSESLRNEAKESGVDI